MCRRSCRRGPMAFAGPRRGGCCSGRRRQHAAVAATATAAEGPSVSFQQPPAHFTAVTPRQYQADPDLPPAYTRGSKFFDAPPPAPASDDKEGGGGGGGGDEFRGSIDYSQLDPEKKPLGGAATAAPSSALGRLANALRSAKGSLRRSSKEELPA